MSDSPPDAKALRGKILDLAAEFFEAEFAKRPFVPGQTPVPVSGKVFDVDDLRSLLDSSRFLAHHRTLRRGVREKLRALRRSTRRFTSQLRIIS